MRSVFGASPLDEFVETESFRLAPSVHVDIRKEDIRTAIRLVVDSLHQSPGNASGYLKRYAVDAILQAGTDYTMGQPVVDSEWQENMHASMTLRNDEYPDPQDHLPLRATPRMVDAVREHFAPESMEAIRNAAQVSGRGEVVRFAGPPPKLADESAQHSAQQPRPF
jgi:hypothetical protein